MAFQDAFTRADENLEANANWVRYDGTAGWGAVRTNALACLTTDATGAAFLAPDTLSEAHYVQAKLRNVTTDSGPFLCCRLADRSNFVGIRYNGVNSTIELYRRVAGTLTQVNVWSTPCVVGDTLRLMVNGSIYNAYKNGVLQGSGSIGATMTGTRCGVVMRTQSMNPWVDDFECGPLPFDFQNAPSSGSLFQPGGPVGAPTWMYDGEKWLRRPVIVGSPTAGYRNVIINADFQLTQRGNPVGGTGARWAADRWYIASVGSSIVSTLPYLPLGVEPKEGFSYVTVTTTSVAGASNYAMMMQRIESVRTLAGKRCTLSFWAFAGGGAPIAVEVTQYFGSGGSPSAMTFTPLGKITGLSNVGFDKRYVISFDMPSIAGKTIGTAGDDYVEVRFWLDAGSSYNVNSSNLGQQSGTFYFAQVQLEEGSFATPFERRPWHVEVELCLRYYEAGIGNTVGFACPSTGGYADNFTDIFKVTKRAAPTMVHSYSGSFNFTAANSLGSTRDWCGVQIVGAGLGNTGIYWTWTASAEL